MGLLNSGKWLNPKSPPIKKETYFFVLFLFLLQDNSYSYLVLKFQVSNLKIAIEVIKLSKMAAKVLIFKTLVTSKLIDLAM